MGTAIIHEDVAWLAHIIVHSEKRNRGYGKAITEYLIKKSPAKDCRSINLVATDLGAPVYEKLGFITETEYVFFKDVDTVKNIPLPGFFEQIQSKHHQQIAKLDHLASGENRFIHLQEHFETGYVYLNNNTLEGFYLPSFGDGLIISQNEKSGLELMKYRLQNKNHAVFPVNNKIALEFIQELGITENRRAKRMWLKQKTGWKPEYIYNRIGGNLG